MAEGQADKKISRLAVTAAWLMLGGAILISVGVMLGGVIGFFPFLPGVIGLILSGPVALIAIVRIFVCKDRLKGNSTAILVVVLWLFCVALVVWAYFGKVKPFMEWLVCSRNMKGLGTALNVYAFDYDDRLPSENWCDLLVSEADVELKSFVCPDSDCKEGQSSYAMNIAAVGKKISELPSDMVVLFESGIGWNQVGGKELINFDNHGGDWCCVVYADGRSERVRIEEVDGLCWTVEEETNGE